MKLLKWIGLFILALAGSVAGSRLAGAQQPPSAVAFFTKGASAECIAPRCWHGLPMGRAQHDQIVAALQANGGHQVRQAGPEVWAMPHDGRIWHIGMANRVGTVSRLTIDPPSGAMQLGDVIAVFGYPIEYAGGLNRMPTGIEVHAELRFPGNIIVYVRTRGLPMLGGRWAVAPTTEVMSIVYYATRASDCPRQLDVFHAHTGQRYCEFTPIR